MPSTVTRLALRSRPDRIVTLPYLLGFHLRDSLVVAALHGSRLGLIQRIDVPRAGARSARSSLQVLRQMLIREDPDGVVLVAYESAPAGSADVRTALARLCDRHGWPVMAHLVVRHGQWWDVDVDDLGRPGTALPDPARVPAVAECVAAGLAPLPDRSTLADLFVSGPEAERVGQAMSVQRACPRRAQLGSADRFDEDARAWSAWLAGPVTPWHQVALSHQEESETLVARCVVALDDLAFRDALLAWLVPTLVPPALVPEPAWSLLTDQPNDQPNDHLTDHPREHGQEWPARPPRTCRNRILEALRLTPETEQAPLLCLFAALVWAEGEGALAGEAVRRARRLRPSYTLALLLERALDHGLRW
ncbi:MAG: DUF4192 domain-containing protein [Austwickia sp.]|nr:DUF4192 domain-containing protein [Austwickia sp.]